MSKNEDGQMTWLERRMQGMDIKNGVKKNGHA